MTLARWQLGWQMLWCELDVLQLIALLAPVWIPIGLVPLGLGGAGVIVRWVGGCQTTQKMSGRGWGASLFLQDCEHHQMPYHHLHMNLHTYSSLIELITYYRNQ